MRPTPWTATLVTLALLVSPALRGRAAASGAGADSLAHRAGAAADSAGAVANSAGADTLGAFAPDFMLPDLDGTPHRFLGYPGRLHVLVYWSPECPECKHELPHLAQLYARERDHGLSLVSVTGGRLGAEAVAYAKEKGYDFPILLDGMGRVVRLYDVRMTPTVCVVRGGRVIYRHEGFDPALPDSVNPAIEALLR